MFDMDLQLEHSPKTVKLIDFDTCRSAKCRSGPGEMHCDTVVNRLYHQLLPSESHRSGSMHVGMQKHSI